MNKNIAMMRGKLADLTEKRKILRRKARLICKEIPTMINPALEDVADMDIAGAASLMDDLVMQQAELLNLESSIKDLEESLYG